MNIREEYEHFEETFLSPIASLSANTKGRKSPEERCSIRTDYQRDRDRIIHSKAFRRLKHKTQVFIAPEGDHYRTRLTHTLEVSQIARTISRALRLNEDLTEAIALGHDLGHTPFGHSGERVLDNITTKGFRHNFQSLRVVEYIEKGNGLNLTWEVRNGILCHSGDLSAETSEGRVVKLADKIAYINHDIDDAIRGGVISKEDLPKDCISVLGSTHSERINTMIIDVIKSTLHTGQVSMTKEIKESTLNLREYMFKNVYIGSEAKTEEKKAMKCIEDLYDYFMQNPDKMPNEYVERIPVWGEETSVCDYIAGMTDRYAISEYMRVFVPSAWNKNY